MEHFTLPGQLGVLEKIHIWKLLQWRHNERDGVSNHRRFEGLFNRLFTHKSKKTWKLRVTGFREGNSPVTGEFPSQRASNTENGSIWWRHHDIEHGPYIHMYTVLFGILLLCLYHEFCVDLRDWLFYIIHGCRSDIGNHPTPVMNVFISKLDHYWRK